MPAKSDRATSLVVPGLDNSVDLAGEPLRIAKSVMELVQRHRFKRALQKQSVGDTAQIGIFFSPT